MTWPTALIDTTDLDADTDSPLQARQDLKDLVDKVNQIMAHVSPFIQELLDDANAASARATLGALAAFPSGTRMLFQQTSAPTGWTKETSSTHNDAALRMTTGTVGTGGADAFSTHFGTGKSTAGFTLTTAEIPIHGHSGSDSGHLHGLHGGGGISCGDISSGQTFQSTGGGVLSAIIQIVNTDTGFANISIGNTGGGGSHAHTLNNFNIKFADCIIASKD